MDNLKDVLQMESLSELSKPDNDFTFFHQSMLRQQLEYCAQETKFDLEAKDTEGEDFNWFANCVKNNVISNPKLSTSRFIREFLGEVHY
mmetsp:Transcript_17904/g.30451  ORF Transcript_17904/g.30451 Transcript_17904/m.30451 type:complete len:89 (+) Transcript_17904:37-303(+)